MNHPQDPQSESDAIAPTSEGSAGSFIVNVCALPRPSLPEHLPLDLEGLRPFISRRSKDGVHRFYLHVGFFQTREEAEVWVHTARVAYPGAFVTEISDSLRPSEPGTPPIADTQMTLVLEARARPGADLGSDTGSYPAPTEAQVLGQPETPAVAWPMSAPVSVSQAPPAKAPVKAATPPQKPKPTDAWSETMAEVNSDSTASVRHLRVEFQRPRNRPGKSPKPRK